MNSITAKFGKVDTNGKWEKVETKVTVYRKWYELWKPKKQTFVFSMWVKTSPSIVDTQVIHEIQQ